MNYAGFDRSQWPCRTNTGHRLSVQKVQESRTKQESNTLESSEGCRYSCLLKLPYFNAPRMLTIDPMHNLFLGTGKHMMQVWLSHGIINSHHFTDLQKIVDSIVVPLDIGRIPHKIATGFSGFTADQIKNWITLYSVPALYGVLPKRHFDCWRYYVLACRILCKRRLTVDEISLFDAFLMKFCTQVQDIYGESSVTPNMHMHGHLKEVVKDYGPVYGFWLFAYERYNGILGYQPNNSRAIEPQLMSCFLRDNFAYNFEYPEEFSQEFGSFCMRNDLPVGSVGATLSDDEQTTESFRSSYRRCVFDAEDKRIVSSLFTRLTGDNSTSVTVNTFYLRYTTIIHHGKLYSCSRSRRAVYDYIALAEWQNELFGPPPTPLFDATHPESKFRPVKIRHYIKASFSGVNNEHVSSNLSLAVVQWYKPHSNKYGIGKPAQLWSHNDFETGASYSFIPIDLLICRCSYSVTSFNGESVLVVIPLSE